MKLLGNVSFGLLGIITLGLTAATIVEKYHGAAATASWFYLSPWMKSLWAATAICATVYLTAHRLRLSRMGMSLHVSLLVILLGALTTHLTGTRGTIRLQEGEKARNTFKDERGRTRNLPFRISLEKCGMEYYPGTSAARDYYSDVRVDKKLCRVSLNKVLELHDYRFYQTSMGDGYTVLSVSHDPLGIAISYTGYALLLVSMTGFFFQKTTRFRRLLRGLCAVWLLLTAGNAEAVYHTPVPQAPTREVAQEMGKLYVYWNDRVAPMESMARDFCLKIYGRTGYRGLTPMQVLSGWLFYYDDWKREPIIKVKGGDVRKLLGVRGKYAAITDFFDSYGYKLENGLREHVGDIKWLEADEKVSLVTMICTGSGLRIAPEKADSGIIWQPLTEDTDYSRAMDMAARELMHGRDAGAIDIMKEIRELQEVDAGTENLPDKSRIASELLYNRMSDTLPAAIMVILAGFGAFALYCRRELCDESKRWERICNAVPIAAGWLVWIWRTTVLALRWITGNHIPLSNGYETMMCLAWVSVLTGLLLSLRLKILLPAGLLTGGFALLVSMMGQNNPAVSNLMPVLQSPLLSLHVMVIMTSYALFAMMALDSVAAFVMRRNEAQVSKLADISTVLLYPALFLLAAGIFIGAVWANQSWGRYWGWDSKETWALITMIVYALPLHSISFPNFRKPMARHIYYGMAFLSVLFTYFGVNYLLTGLHSYGAA